MSQDTSRVGRALESMKNNRIMAIIIVAGVVVIAAAKFKTAVRDLVPDSKPTNTVAAPVSPALPSKALRFHDTDQLRQESAQARQRLGDELAKYPRDASVVNDSRNPTARQITLAELFDAYREVKELEYQRTIQNLLTIESYARDSVQPQLNQRAESLTETRRRLSETWSDIFVKSKVVRVYGSEQARALLKRIERMNIVRDQARAILFVRWEQMSDAERIHALDTFLEYFDDD